MIKLGRKQFLVIVLFLIAAVGIFRVLHPVGIWNKSFAAHSVSKDIYYCPMHPNYTSDRPGNCPICNMTLVKRETENPAAPSMPMAHEPAAAANAPMTFTVEELMKMKPGQICLLHKCKHGMCMMAMTEEAARLGKCPQCGEDLGIIVKNAMPQGYAAVKLSPGGQEAIGIKTAPVKKMGLTKTIRTVGRIAYDPELYQAQQEFLQSMNAFQKAENAEPEIKDQASQLVDSARIKLRLLGLSPELIREVEAAGKPDRSLLYSDAGGSVWLYAPIYENEIPLVKAGDEIEAETSSMPGKKFLGEIRSIDSVLDPQTRSVRVRAVLDNTEGLLKPEMYVNASLQVSLGEGVAVPKDAVFMTGTNNLVFVATEGGHYEPRQVTLGAEADDYYQVKSGLAEGELVVTSGNFLIDSESRLKAALEGMATSGGGEHHHGG